MSELNGRVAVVTGAGRGIGKGIAIALARQGADIIFTYHSNSAAAKQTKRELEQIGVQATAIQADSGDEQAVVRVRDEVKDRYGQINILVNNSGTFCPDLPLVETACEDWDAIINTDLKGVFLFCKYFVPLIAKQPVGKVINISSELSFQGRALYSPYVAAKSGLNGLSRSLAKELAPEVLVNVVAPGPTSTDMVKSMPPELQEYEKDITLLKRFGTVDEIAETVLFLASDKGNYFCGQIISPNGGAVFP